jgi:hypothetical protein
MECQMSPLNPQLTVAEIWSPVSFGRPCPVLLVASALAHCRAKS